MITASLNCPIINFAKFQGRHEGHLTLCRIDPMDNPCIFLAHISKKSVGISNLQK